MHISFFHFKFRRRFVRRCTMRIFQFNLGVPLYLCTEVDCCGADGFLLKVSLSANSSIANIVSDKVTQLSIVRFFFVPVRKSLVRKSRKIENLALLLFS